MELFFRGIIRFRWLIIGLVLSCTMVAWLKLSKLRFESDVDAMVPHDDPSISIRSRSKIALVCTDG
jgi:predicted RND superfamily exporter protein